MFFRCLLKNVVFPLVCAFFIWCGVKFANLSIVNDYIKNTPMNRDCKNVDFDYKNFINYFKNLWRIKKTTINR